MPKIHELFRKLHDQKASDLHLAAGHPPALRVHGEVDAIPGWKPMGEEELRDLLKEIVTDAQWESFSKENDLDFACQLEGVARFRANYFRQQTGTAAVFRQIPEKIIPIDQLGLPAIVKTIAELQSGLVLVTGPTGSGKSTTLASIIDHINNKYARHIVTIEDPIEFVHQNKKSVISQREVGADTNEFQAAVKSALHQDADVVLVGEMRDLETIAQAITAASMGVLVFATLHTSSAAKTIDRIIDAFPADQQPQVRDTLAECLAAVVSQILIKRADTDGRIAAHEILVRTTAVPAAIRDNNTAMLTSIIGSGKRVGMQSMDDVLMDLVERRIISGNDAYMKSQDKRRFQHMAGAVAVPPAKGGKPTPPPPPQSPPRATSRAR